MTAAGPSGAGDAPGDGVPAAGTPLVLRGREVGRGPDGALRPVVMAIVNRTTDSFYAPARLTDDGAAIEAAHRAWA